MFLSFYTLSVDVNPLIHICNKKTRDLSRQINILATHRKFYLETTYKKKKQEI